MGQIGWCKVCKLPVHTMMNKDRRCRQCWMKITTGAGAMGKAVPRKTRKDRLAAQVKT